MRIGYTTSVIGHALLLAWGLVSLPGAKPFEVEQIEALPVDLVPIDDVTAISEGTTTAPLADTASQAKIQNPVPRPDSERVGRAPTDQATPVTETATDTEAAPTSETEPPPPPPPAPERPPEPKPPEPEPPPPEPEPEPPPPEPEPPEPAPPPPEPEPPPPSESGEIAAAPEPTPEATPAPVPPSAKPRSKPTPPRQVAAARPTDAPARPPAERTADRAPDKPQREFDPNELAALLNKVDPSGGGGRSSDRDPSLGSERVTGAVARMTQSELDALSGRIAQCFNPPIGAENVVDLVVPLRVQFNIDGTIAGSPEVTRAPSDPVGRAIADAAIRAVRRCAPYGDILRPEKYAGGWETVNMNFRPPNSY